MGHLTTYFSGVAINWMLYKLGNDGIVTLNVFNSLGEEVAELVNQFKKAGSHQIIFSADNLPSGIYVYRLLIEDHSESRKMILMK